MRLAPFTLVYFEYYRELTGTRTTAPCYAFWRTPTHQFCCRQAVVSAPEDKVRTSTEYWVRYGTYPFLCFEPYPTAGAQTQNSPPHTPHVPAREGGGWVVLEGCKTMRLKTPISLLTEFHQRIPHPAKYDYRCRLMLRIAFEMWLGGSTAGSNSHLSFVLIIARVFVSLSLRIILLTTASVLPRPRKGGRPLRRRG